MPGKWKKVKVINDTNNNTRGIINFLLSEGHSASRVNVQGQFEPVTSKYHKWALIAPMVKALKRFGLVVGSWRKSGSRIGYYDVSVCLKCRSGIGVFHAIDFKGEGDKLSKEQIEFKHEVQKAGGIVIEVGSLPEYEEYYHTFLKPNIIDKL